MRTLLIDPAYSQVDDGKVYPYPQPDDYWADLSVLLGRAHSRMIAHGGTVLLTEAAALQLGLKPTPDEQNEQLPPPDIRGHHDATLTCPRWRAWMEWKTPKREQRLFVGVLPWMERGDAPLVQPFPEDTAILVDQWGQVTGAPWFGAPGAAGTTLMRETVRYRHKGQLIQPRWTLDPGQYPPGVFDEWAEAENTAKWNNPRGIDPDTTHLHTYDVRRSWLAAAYNAICAYGPLKLNTRIDEYEQRTAGWFLVKSYGWEHTDKLPDPCPGTRWVSHSRLGLIHEWARKGIHPGYEIVTAYTAGGTELLRPWTDALEMAFHTPELSSAVKSVYARTPMSMMAAPYFDEKAMRYVYRSVVRPDWAAAVVGLAQANMMRNLWAAGKQSGRWPIAIHEDQPTYASTDPYAIGDAVAIGLPMDNRRGKFKVKSTRTLAREAP